MWIKILLQGGICLERGMLRRTKKELETDTLTLLRGIRLFKKLNMIDNVGQIIFNDEGRRRYMRQYMRAYRKAVPKDEISKAVKKIRRNVDFESFDPINRGIINELITVAAEVLCLPNDEKISIDGVEMPVQYVKSVYLKLNYEHLSFAYQRYMSVSKKITKVKDYLRVLLYNVYFEMLPSYTNQVNYEKI